MLENDMGQIQDAKLSKRSDKIKDIVDMVIDAIAKVIFRTDPAGQLAVGSGKKWKRAELLFKNPVVHMDQDDFIGIRSESVQNFLIPTARAHNHVIVQQHDVFTAGDSVTVHVERAH